MKVLNKVWGISLLAFLLIMVAPHKSTAQDEDISEQDFYDNLEPYGTWINDPQYGDVWVPDAEDDFRPYATRGHWVITEYGNTWASDYPWGWATFHYGRWRYDDYYGWEWIPGYEWAPAWVSWRQGGGYYGWAPLTPGISISLSFGGGYNVPDYYWVCAPQAYINRPNIYNYYVPHTRVVNIIHNTTIINNTYSRNNRRYIAGPRVQDIQRYTRQRPQIYTINNASRPGAINIRNNAINIYRPAVRKTAGARPARVVDANAYKQQNPNQGIAHRGPGGAAAYNHANASKLAAIARDPNANNKVVRVNRPGGRPNPAQPGNAPGQHGNRPGGEHGNRPAQPNVAQPVNTPGQPNPAQPGNTPGQHGNRPVGERGNRPGQPNTTQQGNTPEQPNTAQPGNAPGQHGNRPGSQRGNRPSEPKVAQPGNSPVQPTNQPNVGRPNRTQQPVNTEQQQQRIQREQQRTQRQQQAQQAGNAQQAQRQQQQAQQQQRQAQQQQVQQQQQAQRQQQQEAQQQQRQVQQQAQRQQQQQAQQQQRQAQQQQRQMQQQQRQQQQQQQHRQPPPQQPRPEEHRPEEHRPQ